MANKKTVLSPNEWKLMQALWGSGKPMAIAEIMRVLENTVSWSTTTYQSQMERLVKSGYVGFERHGRMRLFYPIADMEQCVREEESNIRDKMPPEASTQLVLSLLRDAGSISHAQAEDLRLLIDTLEEKGKQQ